MRETDEARVVFESWMRVFDKRASTRLTSDRMRKIRARMREGYSAEDLMLAVEGARKDAWLIEHGYTDLVTILKSAASVDRHMDRARRPDIAESITEGIARPEVFARLTDEKNEEPIDYGRAY